MRFLEWKCRYFASNFTGICSWGSNLFLGISICSGNGLVQLTEPMLIYVASLGHNWVQECRNLSSHGSLTHWGRVTHICVNKQSIIGSDNGLSPGRRQAIIWTNDGIFLIGPLGTNFSEISIKILTFSFTKIRLKVSSAKWRPFCLGLNVLNTRAMTAACDGLSPTPGYYSNFWWSFSKHPLLGRIYPRNLNQNITFFF